MAFMADDDEKEGAGRAGADGYSPQARRAEDEMLGAVLMRTSDVAAVRPVCRFEFLADFARAAK